MGLRGAALAAALICIASQVAIGRAGATDIGVIYPECCAAYDSAILSFKTELAAGGYGTGKTRIYEQKPATDLMSWTNACRKFVGADVDLIVILGDEMLEIACREKTKVPVLFGFVSYPTAARCIKSAESPGRNVTGISAAIPIFTLLDKAKKVGKFSTIGVFNLEGSAPAAATLKEIRSHEDTLGYGVVPINSPDRSGLSEVLRAASPFDILLLPDFTVGTGRMAELERVASARKIPAISLIAPEEGSASLISLYPDPAEQGRLMGEMALRLLGGEPAAKTALGLPKKIELEINLGLARQYGLKVPMDVLKTATKVRK